AAAVTEAAYTDLVARTVRGLTREPEVLLSPLRHRMLGLAANERFEEAADVRDRARALAHALRRQRRYDAVRDAGRLVITFGDTGASFEQGRLVQAWAGDQLPLDLDLSSTAEDEGPAVPAGSAAELAVTDDAPVAEVPVAVQGRLHLSTHPDLSHVTGNHPVA